MELVHIWPGAHAPHVSVPPHASGIDPQLAPFAAHVVGVQDEAQTLALVHD
jgi:hypothetical protein